MPKPAGETPTLPENRTTRSVRARRFPQGDVKAEGNRESNKPGIAVKRDEKCRHAAGGNELHGHEKAWQVRKDRGEQCDERDDAEPVRVAIFVVVPVERVQV